MLRLCRETGGGLASGVTGRPPDGAAASHHHSASRKDRGPTRRPETAENPHAGTGTPLRPTPSLPRPGPPRSAELTPHHHARQHGDPGLGLLPPLLGQLRPPLRL